ncbi:penicillin-binding protein [Lactobacillus sp. DCY120]|uniref:Penicillin-binding protein n=1 Tax=Bombilactobacillus apium TaxID=2675299 RepID=A0A850R5J3_9LACO|nr:transglycosylase domain-containing protein [Bombilactobacillus apium]NVY95815.1 penicillin-binding protein [Bombilactobacillus apium]
MSNSRLQKYHRSKSPFKRWFWRLFWGLIALIVLIAGILFYYGSSAPKISQRDLTSGGSSTIYDTNGKLITALGTESRTYVTIDQVPRQMQDAVISIEDRHFYQEQLGINPLRIAKAAVNNLRNRDDDGEVQGGSTLTQQLVKLSVFSTKKSDQTFKRKLQEAWLSMKVESQYSKDQILEYYLNKVYLANGTYGFQTAARYYYGKNLKQLTLPQMALLAGMPQAPSYYDPYKNPSVAKNRRDLVLKAMLSNHKISDTQAQEALATPIQSGLRTYHPNAGLGENKLVVDPYIKEVIQNVKKKGFDPYRDNLKITVNMDITAQKQLYTLVNDDSLAFPDQNLQTGVSVVNPNNGAVVAMIGGRKLGDVQLGLNRAVQTSRSNGSTMKPLMDYAPAIEYLHWATNHTVVDSPYRYPGTDVDLQNWDNNYLGTMTMREALAQSRNVPAIRTLSSVGFNRAKTFVGKLGIKVGSDAGLSAGIGSNISSLQLASAYAAFANGGIYYQPQYVDKIQTTDGVVHQYSPEGQRAMSASTAYLITDILKDVVKTTGMGSQAYISGLYQAGKTGTTNYSSEELARNPILAGQAKDSLFAGYTPNYSIGVWTGYDQPNLNGLSQTQQKLAGEIYQRLMSDLAVKTTNRDFTKPDDVVQVSGTDVLYVQGYQPSHLPSPKNNKARDNRTTDSSAATSRSYQNSTDGNQAPSEKPDSDQNSTKATPDQDKNKNNESKPAEDSKEQNSNTDNNKSSNQNNNSETNSNGQSSTPTPPTTDNDAANNNSTH